MTAPGYGILLAICKAAKVIKTVAQCETEYQHMYDSHHRTPRVVTVLHAKEDL